MLGRGNGGSDAGAARTIDVATLDAMSYDPDDIRLDVGETISFRRVESRKGDPWFVLGEEPVQMEYEEQAIWAWTSGRARAICRR